MLEYIKKFDLSEREMSKQFNREFFRKVPTDPKSRINRYVILQQKFSMIV